MISNFHSSRVHVQWNVQSIGDIISFRIYDSYFHHDVRGHGAGVTLTISMRMDFFFFFFLRFSCRFFPPFLSLSLSSHFPFYWAFISYFCFGLAYSLRQAGLLKKDKVKVDFQNSIFQVFSAFESFWCPSSVCFRTDTMGIEGHGTGTYKEIIINRIHE